MSLSELGKLETKKNWDRPWQTENKPHRDLAPSNLGAYSLNLNNISVFIITPYKRFLGSNSRTLLQKICKFDRRLEGWKNYHFFFLFKTCSCCWCLISLGYNILSASSKFNLNIEVIYIMLHVLYWFPLLVCPKWALNLITRVSIPNRSCNISEIL